MTTNGPTGLSKPELPPAPAALLGDALAGSPPSSTQHSRSSSVDMSDLDTGNNSSTSIDTPGAAFATRTQLDSDAATSANPSTTTTITTKVQDAQGKTSTTSETIQHVGADAMAAKFSRDGSFSLRPIAARGRASKVRTHRTHTFRARISAFDRDNPLSQADPFRGFWTLFWIVIFIAAVRTGVKHYGEEGVIWGSRFATLISEDARMLAFSDGVMVSSTILCVPFMQLVLRGWIRYNYTGMIIQHVLQALFLGLSVRWTFHRNWPWVQSGFMTLHTLTMLMKVHSYCSYNGELSEKALELKRKEYKLEELVIDLGGRTKVESAAQSTWISETKRAKSPEEQNLSAEHLSAENGGLTRRRGDSTGSKPPLMARRSSSHGRTVIGATGAPVGYDLLSWHPNEDLAVLAVDCALLNESLRSTGIDKITWPANVTYMNYLDYLLVPTLVYELSYPRVDRIRPTYILEKTLATFGTFSLLVLIVEHYILPHTNEIVEKSFLMSALDLAIPFMVNYLLIFFIIFECILNVFAEVTRFSDREFYQDWWNSTSFDEFSRKWNIPVHSFLLRHVYASTITTYRFSKFKAAFVTFLLSACVHELVMAIVTKKLRPYLFGMQMAQLPLIMIGRMPVFRKYPAIGNLFFWLGLFSGFPLLAVAYLRH